MTSTTRPDWSESLPELEPRLGRRSIYAPFPCCPSPAPSTIFESHNHYQPSRTKVLSSARALGRPPSYHILHIHISQTGIHRGVHRLPSDNVDTMSNPACGHINQQGCYCRNMSETGRHTE